MRTKRIKHRFQLAGAATVGAGVLCVLFGIWVAFFKQVNGGFRALPDIISGAICFSIAAMLVRFGRDMISYYRIK